MPTEASMEYDESKILQMYMFNYCAHLMTDTERKVEQAISARTRASWFEEHGKRDAAMRYYEEFGWVHDADVNAALADGPEVFRGRVIERLLTDPETKNCINRCPRCRRLVRTPKAKQCLWCAFDWHEYDRIRVEDEDQRTWLEPWHPLEGDDDRVARFELQLKCEIGPGLLLFGRNVSAIAHSWNDDILFQILNHSSEVAVVHLTWNAFSPDRESFPRTTIYDSFEDFANKEMRPTHNRWRAEELACRLRDRFPTASVVVTDLENGGFWLVARNDGVHVGAEFARPCEVNVVNFNEEPQDAFGPCGEGGLMVSSTEAALEFLIGAMQTKNDASRGVRWHLELGTEVVAYIEDAHIYEFPWTYGVIVASPQFERFRTYFTDSETWADDDATIESLCDEVLSRGGFILRDLQSGRVHLNPTFNQKDESVWFRIG